MSNWNNLKVVEIRMREKVSCKKYSKIKVVVDLLDGFR
jgi:hypothetical protein